MATDRSGSGFWPEGFWSPGEAALRTAERWREVDAKNARRNARNALIRCHDCGSTDLNILGAMCRRCGANLADPGNLYLEEEP